MTTTTIVIDPKILAYSDLLEQASKFEHIKGNQNATVKASEDAIEKILPEGITKEIYRTVSEFTGDLASAASYMLGKMSIPEMKKHSEIESVTFELPLTGKDKIVAQFDRTTTYPGKNEAGEQVTKTKFGSSSVKIDMYDVGPRGELKKIKQLLSEQAASVFGK